jgi:hypothetical protein
MAMDNALNEWSSAFSFLGSLHLLGIVCALGPAALVNLRLLGVGNHGSPAKLWRETLLPSVGGLAVAITSGFLLFTIAPGEYLGNQVFRYKIGTLLAAILFYFTAVRWAALRERKAPGVAIVSLALYALVPLGGILVGYE